MLGNTVVWNKVTSHSHFLDSVLADIKFGCIAGMHASWTIWVHGLIYGLGYFLDYGHTEV